jgi:hypothetical protein
MAQRDQKQPDLASAMWPGLSREVRQREAEQAKAREEQKARIKRTAANLQAAIDAVRRERGC